MKPSRQTLERIYDRLLKAYGPQGWWPAETRFEVMVGAMLTQNTSWTNVEKALANIKAADALTAGALREVPQDDLATLVYPSGYYNGKARKLKALAEYLGRRFDDDIDAMKDVETAELRAELLDVYGIGEETADDIMLYAVGKARLRRRRIHPTRLRPPGAGQRGREIWRPAVAFPGIPGSRPSRVPRVPCPDSPPRERNLPQITRMRELLPARPLPHGR